SLAKMPSLPSSTKCRSGRRCSARRPVEPVGVEGWAKRNSSSPIGHRDLDFLAIAEFALAALDDGLVSREFHFLVHVEAGWRVLTRHQLDHLHGHAILVLNANAMELRDPVDDLAD